MASKCPQITSREWSELVSRFGGNTDTAYFFWNSNGSHVPNEYSNTINDNIRSFEKRIGNLKWDTVQDENGKNKPRFRYQGFDSIQYNEKIEDINNTYSGNIELIPSDGEVGGGKAIKPKGWPVDTNGLTLNQAKKKVDAVYLKQKTDVNHNILRPAQAGGLEVDSSGMFANDSTYVVVGTDGQAVIGPLGETLFEYKANTQGTTLNVTSENITEDQFEVLKDIHSKRGVEEININDEIIPIGHIIQDDVKSNPLYEYQKKVLQNSLPYVEEIIEDTKIPVAGQLEAGGRTIRINPTLMSNDTLGHEFGHLLIDLRGGMDNKFIRKGREKLVGTKLEADIAELYPEYAQSEDPLMMDKFDKEVLAQAIGLQVAELTEGNWLNRFLNWLAAKLKTSNDVILELAQELVSGDVISEDTFSGSAADFIQQQRVDYQDAQEMADAIKAVSDAVKFDADSHTYSLAGKTLEPVSTVMSRYGYGMAKEDENAAIIRGQKIGTTAHEEAEGAIIGLENVVRMDTGFSFTSGAKADMKKILEDLYGDDYILLTEVIVVDEKSGIAGTIDVLAIDKISMEVKMFDYKNKEKFDKNGNPKGFKFYDSTTFANSQRSVNSTQLSMYNLLLKKSLNVSVDEMHIVPLVNDVNKYNKITSVELDEISTEGTIQLAYVNTVNKMYNETISHNEENAKLLSDMSERMGVSPEVAKENEELLKNQELINKQLTGFEKQYDAALDLLDVQIREAEGRKDLLNAEHIKGLVARIKGLEAREGVLEFTSDAIARINSTFNVYTEKKAKFDKGDKDVFTPQLLMKWYDVMKGYSIIDDITKEFLTTTFDNELHTAKELQNMLSDASSKRVVLEKAFADVGKPTVVKMLAPHSTRIYGEFKEQKQREWRELSKEDQSKVSEQEYVDKALFDNNEILKQRTEILLNNELDEASEDINIVYRWLDNLLDSNDMVVAALVKKYVTQEELVRKKNIHIKDDLVAAIRGLETFTNYNVSSPIEKMYDFMLEKDSKGRYTGHRITKFSSALERAEDKMIADTANDGKLKARNRREWRKENMPLDKDRFQAALYDYVRGLLRSGVMSQSEFDSYVSNESETWEDRNDDLLEVAGEEAGNAILHWIMNNHKEYRDPASKWKSSQYVELQSILKDSSDPRSVVYNMIDKLSREADEQLPGSAKLDSKLPSVLKTAVEQAQSGGGVSKTVKTALDTGLVKRSDDLDKGVLTSTGGKQLDSIPIFYQRTEGWDIKDQSFDLGSIYYRYAKMANQYENKSSLLAEMELTKLFVETRDYKETDAKGNPITKVINSAKQKSLTKSGQKALIAEQLGDWFKTEMYGQHKVDEGDINLFGYKVDKAKAFDLLGKYTSLNLLGLNVVQAVNNVTFGEIQQAIEAVAGEHFNAKDLTKGTKTYFNNFAGMAGDFGARTNSNWVGKLVEEWDILNDYDDGNLSNSDRFSNSFNTSALFAFAHAGEHFMQTRVMLAMLSKKNAYSKKGKLLGTMDQMYRVNKLTGRLEIKPEVDLVKSNWSAEEQVMFGQKVKRILAKLHGEYSDTAKNAAQRYIIGRMGIMFRKFMFPGWKKRWDRKKYNEFIGSHTEGDYHNTLKFVKAIYKDLAALRVGMIQDSWSKLLPREKANIIRASMEVSLAIGFAVMASAFMGAAGDEPDDFKKLMYNHMAYLTGRLSSESSFFFNPKETITILRSPMAAMSVVENSITLLGQIMPPSADGFDEYKTGSWKGRFKINKTLMKLTPGVKQYYRVVDIEDVVNIFNK